MKNYNILDDHNIYDNHNYYNSQNYIWIWHSDSKFKYLLTLFGFRNLNILFIMLLPFLLYVISISNYYNILLYIIIYIFVTLLYFYISLLFYLNFNSFNNFIKFIVVLTIISLFIITGWIFFIIFFATASFFVTNNIIYEKYIWFKSFKNLKKTYFKKFILHKIFINTGDYEKNREDFLKKNFIYYWDIKK